MIMMTKMKTTVIKDKSMVTKIYTKKSSPVHLGIPVRAGILLTNQHVVHQGLGHLVDFMMSENTDDFG